MLRTRHTDAAAPGSNWPKRCYWKPLTVPQIKAKVRAVVQRMQRRRRATIAFGVFYVGLGDRFDDDRRRVAEHRNQENF
jgi:hypothetical protein